MKKRLYSLLLASVLMAASLPASQAASSPVVNASKSVAVGGKTKSVSAVRVNLADPDIRIISVTAGNVGDVAELTDIIAKIDPSAYELLAAVNGAFFRSYDAGAQPIVGTIILTANPASEAPETASGPAQRSFAGLSADAKTLVFGTV